MCASPHSLTHLNVHQTDLLSLVSQVKVEHIGNTTIGSPAKATRDRPCLNQPSVKLQYKALVLTADHQLMLLLRHQGRDPLKLNPTFLPCPTQLAAQLAANIRVYQVPAHCRVNQQRLLLPTLHRWRPHLRSRMKLKSGTLLQQLHSRCLLKPQLKLMPRQWTTDLSPCLQQMRSKRLFNLRMMWQQQLGVLAGPVCNHPSKVQDSWICFQA